MKYSLNYFIPVFTFLKLFWNRKYPMDWNEAARELIYANIMEGRQYIKQPYKYKRLKLSENLLVLVNETKC